MHARAQRLAERLAALPQPQRQQVLQRMAEQGIEAAILVQEKPAADRVAMEAKQAGDFLTLVGLPTCQQIEQLQPRFLAPIVLTL